MLVPAAADNGPFWAGSELGSVTAQSHRPHVARGIKHCTPKVTKHNSKRKAVVLNNDVSPPIIEDHFDGVHSSY